MNNQTLSEKDFNYFSELANKYRSYSKPTDIQRLLVALYDVKNKNDDDIKKIKALLKTERTAEQLFKEQQKLNEILKAEKDHQRKLLEHKKFLIGGGLWSAINSNLMFNETISYKQIFQQMISQGIINPTDKNGNNLFNDLLKVNHANS